MAAARGNREARTQTATATAAAGATARRVAGTLATRALDPTHLERIIAARVSSVLEHERLTHIAGIERQARTELDAALQRTIAEAAAPAPAPAPRHARAAAKEQS